MGKCRKKLVNSSHKHTLRGCSPCSDFWTKISFMATSQVLEFHNFQHKRWFNSLGYLLSTLHTVNWYYKQYFVTFLDFFYGKLICLRKTSGVSLNIIKIDLMKSCLLYNSGTPDQLLALNIKTADFQVFQASISMTFAIFNIDQLQ